MKKILVILCLIMLLFPLSSLSAAGGREKIYIKPFVKMKGVFDITITDEVRDYMSEALAGDYSLISDDEVKVYLSNMAIGQALGSDANAEKLIAGIKTDYLIHGRISKKGNDYMIEATLLSMAGGTVSIKNIGDIQYSRRNYTDRAARALARYLMMDKKKIGVFFGKEDPREKFREEIKDVEEQMNRIECRYRAGSESIKRAARWRDKSLIMSPRYRIGYSGFGMFVPMNEGMRELYEPQHLVFADLFFYRYKDPVGDGIDIYARGTYRQFRAAGSYNSLVKIASDSSSRLGRFSQVPLEQPELMVASGDVGIRFVGSVYALRSAVSFYLSLAGRFNYAIEKAELPDGSEEKTIRQWGAVGGFGMEISFFPSGGLFVEFNAGYVPMGRDDINLEGPQLLAGITMRTRHWDN